MSTELHEVVEYKGRKICSCGDFNCASLDSRPNAFNGSYVVSPQREAVMKAYPTRRWASKINKMDDGQVHAIFMRLKAQHVI